MHAWMNERTNELRLEKTIKRKQEQTNEQTIDEWTNELRPK